MAYSDAIVQSEIHLVTLGLTPKNVHFDIRKIDISELPDTNEELELWIKTLWKEKEERLRVFYSQTNPNRRLDVRKGGQNFEVISFKFSNLYFDFFRVLTNISFLL